jgi:hypothetical protein
VSFENNFAAVGKVPANDGAILGGGKEILAGGIEPAIDQRSCVRQRFGKVNLFRIRSHCVKPAIP